MPVRESDGSGAPLLLEHILSGPAQHDVEVHTVDTDVRVVLDTQIDMLSNTEAKVALVGEVFTPQLELLNLESPLEDLLCFGSPDGAMDRDLLVPAGIVQEFNSDLGTLSLGASSAQNGGHFSKFDWCGSFVHVCIKCPYESEKLLDNR